MFSNWMGLDRFLTLDFCCNPPTLHKLDEITVKNSAKVEDLQVYKEKYLETS